MNKQLRIAALAAAAIVLGGGGFVAGMTVGPTIAKTDAAAASASPGPAGAAARRQQGGGAAGTGIAQGSQQVSGRVISVNDGSITVETRQPAAGTTQSVIVLVGGSARVVKTTEVDIKLTDIKPGDQVLILGQPDQATGTVTANAVVVGINALQQLFGGERPGGGAGPGVGGQFVRPSGSPGARPLPSASPRP